MAHKRDKVTKRKPESEEELPHCSEVAIGTRMPETKRTLRLASSSSEKEVENETSGEASSSGEKEKTITEVIGDDPNEILYPNLIEES